MSSVVLMCYVCQDSWPYSDIRSFCCQSVHAFNSRYDSTLLGCTFLYTEDVIAWDIITFVRFMHRYRSRIFDSHIAGLLPWQKLIRRYISQCTFFHWLYNLHWIFNLKQEMYYIYSFIILIQRHWQTTVNPRYCTFSRV